MATPDDEILLHEILAEIQAIARKSYAGRDIENISFIFAKLSADKKRIFLEKALNLFLVMDRDFQRRTPVCELPHVEPGKEVKPKVPEGPKPLIEVDSNAIPLDEYNERLLLKLRNKMALLAGTGAMIFLLVILFLVIFLGYGAELGGFIANLREAADTMINYDTK